MRLFFAIEEGNILRKCTKNWDILCIAGNASVLFENRANGLFATCLLNNVFVLSRSSFCPIVSLAASTVTLARLLLWLTSLRFSPPPRLPAELRLHTIYIQMASTPASGGRGSHRSSRAARTALLDQETHTPPGSTPLPWLPPPLPTHTHTHTHEVDSLAPCRQNLDSLTATPRPVCAWVGSRVLSLDSRYWSARIGTPVINRRL